MTPKWSAAPGTKVPGRESLAVHPQATPLPFIIGEPDHAAYRRHRVRSRFGLSDAVAGTVAALCFGEGRG